MMREEKADRDEVLDALKDKVGISINWYTANDYKV